MASACRHALHTAAAVAPFDTHAAGPRASSSALLLLSPSQALEQSHREIASLRSELSATQHALSEARRQLSQLRSEMVESQASLEAETTHRLGELMRTAQQQVR